MKNFITCLILVISNSAFAGGGSVGTMKTAKEALLNNGQGNMKVGQPNIIYSMGQKDGLVRYALGQLVQGQWEIQEMTLPIQSVSENFEFVKSLTESQEKNDWAELKP